MRFLRMDLRMDLRLCKRIFKPASVYLFLLLYSFSLGLLQFLFVLNIYSYKYHPVSHIAHWNLYLDISLEAHKTPYYCSHLYSLARKKVILSNLIDLHHIYVLLSFCTYLPTDPHTSNSPQQVVCHKMPHNSSSKDSKAKSRRRNKPSKDNDSTKTHHGSPVPQPPDVSNYSGSSSGTHTNNHNTDQDLLGIGSQFDDGK